MANKPAGDVTRQAIELASLKLKRATAKLRTILYTGPDNVLLSRKEIDKRVADGDTALLPYASKQSPEGVDNALLDQMLMNGDLRGR
jgi:hypothetical protein